MSSTTPPQNEYDLIGCGFGPANIGIAVALLDSEQVRPSLLFLSLFSPVNSPNTEHKL